jgi:hypothetical protein
MVMVSEDGEGRAYASDRRGSLDSSEWDGAVDAADAVDGGDTDLNGVTETTKLFDGDDGAAASKSRSVAVAGHRDSDSDGDGDVDSDGDGGADGKGAALVSAMNGDVRGGDDDDEEKALISPSSTARLIGDDKIGGGGEESSSAPKPRATFGQLLCDRNVMLSATLYRFGVRLAAVLALSLISALNPCAFGVPCACTVCCAIRRGSTRRQLPRPRDVLLQRGPAHLVCEPRRRRRRALPRERHRRVERRCRLHRGELPRVMPPCTSRLCCSVSRFRVDGVHVARTRALVLAQMAWQITLQTPLSRRYGPVTLYRWSMVLSGAAMFATALSPLFGASRVMVWAMMLTTMTIANCSSTTSYNSVFQIIRVSTLPENLGVANGEGCGCRRCSCWCCLRVCSVTCICFCSVTCICFCSVTCMYVLLWARRHQPVARCRRERFVLGAAHDVPRCWWWWWWGVVVVVAMMAFMVATLSSSSSSSSLLLLLS